MTARRSILVHHAPGETRAAAFDGEERPFRLFVQRWGGVGEAARRGDVITGRLRQHAPEQGGSFVELTGGENVFVRLAPRQKPSEGAEVHVNIQAEARAGKLARGKLVASPKKDEQTAFERWRTSTDISADKVEIVRDVAGRDQIAQAFDEALAEVCGLPGGGNIHIAETRALIAVDIDAAGRISKGSAGARALSINREAASEAARQMSLRNLGGLMALDCVAPLNVSAGAKVTDSFLATFKSCSTRPVEALKPSPFGLMEAKLSWGEAPISHLMFDESGQMRPDAELLNLFRAAERETVANRTGFYRLTLSKRALSAYIARRKRCDDILRETFSGRVSISSGTGETSVVRRE
ncbi:ribonuclease E/G [Henriciella litoralis]|uniref:ribonuclease E/G n=1 Tax=Henriciella litoralis TaxID=568102 RepID=UPI0009FBB7CF|nr:ribonuclease E/G [Henriciella litoralis]